MASFNEQVANSARRKETLRPSLAPMSDSEMLEYARRIAHVPLVPLWHENSQVTANARPAPGYLLEPTSRLSVIAAKRTHPYMVARDEAIVLVNRYMRALKRTEPLLNSPRLRSHDPARTRLNWLLLSHVDAQQAIFRLVDEAIRLGRADTWLPQTLDSDNADVAGKYLLVEDGLLERIQDREDNARRAVDYVRDTRRHLTELAWSLDCDSRANSRTAAIITAACGISSGGGSWIAGAPPALAASLTVGGLIAAPLAWKGRTVIDEGAKRSTISLVHGRAETLTRQCVEELLELVSCANDACRTAVAITPMADLSDGGRGYLSYTMRGRSADTLQHDVMPRSDREIGLL